MRLNDKEIAAFKYVKQVALSDYCNHFIHCAYLLWPTISKSEHDAIGAAAFEGYLANKRTKGISNETSNAALNEPHHPPGVIGDMQRNIATSAARNEFNKL